MEKRIKGREMRGRLYQTAAVLVVLAGLYFESGLITVISILTLGIAAVLFLEILERCDHILGRMPGKARIHPLREIKSRGKQLEIEMEKILEGCREEADKDRAVELLTKQAELSALQSQINPHFLYNTLESIRGRALVEDCGDVAEMAEALAGLFRYSISRKGELVTLGEEFYNLDNYFLIQQYRFPNKFQVCYEVEDEALLSVLLPRMSIQPLVENAIYHGLETKVGKGDISIKATEYESRIEISIRDNGTGIADEKLRQLNLWLAQGRNPKEMRAEQVGIALLNVNKRVALRFGGEYGLRIYSTVGYGTDVRLTIPKTAEEAG